MVNVEIVTIALAFLALGLLIMIHELGHYWMAKRVGMKVEVFSVGFGKPLFSWQRGEERWQIGWFPFGGYVKIAGMDLASEPEEEEKESSFFHKSPWERIKVAAMGPLVNLLFAFLIFCLIWASGGRVKPSSELTPLVGWVDPRSELYLKGLRPGDQILSYGEEPFKMARDHVYGAMISGEEVQVEGLHVDYETGEKKPFSYTLKPYPADFPGAEELKTLGIQPANGLIYREADEGFYKNAPIQESGIREGDLLVWADGQRIFSLQQLKQLLNEERALLTVERKGRRFLARAPRVQIEDLRISAPLREEFSDWQYAAGLSGRPLFKLRVLPYDLTPDAVVEKRLDLLDEELAQEVFPEEPFSELERPLQVGDRLVAVDGYPLSYASELFARLQGHRVHLIVLRNPELNEAVDLDAHLKFWMEELKEEELNRLAEGIGAPSGPKESGELHLLEPVTPKPLREFAMSEEESAEYEAQLDAMKHRILSIADSEARARQEEELEKKLDDPLLGAAFVDQKISYNPGPFQLFFQSVNEFFRTLTALFTGNLSPKWLSGPVGIVAVMQQSWQVSLAEGLFWIGFISLNLGILNLMPIPVLDGGYICLFLYELVSGRKIKKRHLEKLLIPFVFLLVFFFLYITYHDLSRLFDWLLY